MEWQFGYNCANYLPTISKCRILIDLYRTRKGLTELRWFDSRDVLVYLNAPMHAILDMISSKAIKVKLQKDATAFKFGLSVASAYDDCFLAKTGGQCLYFVAHSGQHIGRTMDLDKAGVPPHPNLALAPTEKDVGDFEAAVRLQLAKQAEA